MNHQVFLKLQLVCKNIHRIPSKKKIQSWVNHIFHMRKRTELTIRVVDIQEMKYLNWYYVGKNFPTNVLSFPYSLPFVITSSLIGDIVICQEVIEFEAKKNMSFLYAHWAHMIIHGSLHLLGYNHISDKETMLMQQLEENLIKKFGYQMCCYSINN